MTQFIFDEHEDFGPLFSEKERCERCRKTKRVALAVVSTESEHVVYNIEFGICVTCLRELADKARAYREPKPDRSVSIDQLEDEHRQRLSRIYCDEITPQDVGVRAVHRRRGGRR